MLYKNVSDKSITIKGLFGHVTIESGESKDLPFYAGRHDGLLLIEPVKVVKSNKPKKKDDLDVNGDGKVDLKDVIAVAKKAVGKKKKVKKGDY